MRQSSHWDRSFQRKIFLILFFAGAFATSLRLHGEGALDQQWGAGVGPSDDVFAVAPLPSGGFVLGGFFTSFDGTERWRLARVHGDGTLDPTFDPGDSSGASPITQVVPLPGGKILAAGSFTRFAGLPHRLVVRLDAKGQVDATFDASTVFAQVDGRVNVLQALPDGRILVGGRFDATAPTRRKAGTFLVRLLPDGAMDPTFHCEPLPRTREDGLGALAVLPDHTLLVGTGTTLLHLKANGALEADFHLSPEQGGQVTALAPQTDGKIVVALSVADGWRVLRLEPDGQVDPVFHRSEEHGASAGKVHALLFQNDGKILLGGTFTEMSGKRRHGLARLTENGMLDLTFEPGTGVEVIPLDEADETPEAAVRVLLSMADGSLLIAGRFDLYNGVIRHNLAKLAFAQAAHEPGTNPAPKPAVKPDALP